MKNFFRILLTCAVVLSMSYTAPMQTFAATSTYYYVSASGNDSNSGTSKHAPFKTLDKALEKANANVTIFLMNGTYKPSSTYKLSKTGSFKEPIKILAYSGHTPVIDFARQKESSANRGFQITGSYWILSNLTIKNAGDNGIFISGSHNRIQDCNISYCHDTGLQMSNGAAYNEINHVTSTHNYDSATDGENADGFAAKLNIGPKNTFKNCHALYNSDDGYDCYHAGNAVSFYDCEAANNGTHSGNGQGFKVGGDYTADKHYLKDCISTNNKARGYDQNNNTGAVTLVNCTGTGNNVNFYFPKAAKVGTCSFYGCISKNGAYADKVVGSINNCSFRQ